METIRIPNANLQFSRIGLGTWAMGGWMWGGTDKQESIRTIHSAIDRGITLIDTAPVYGFGTSEEIVGKALASGRLRKRVVIATKVGLDWAGGEPFRNATRNRIFAEIEASLKRLQTDVIDIYQVHWPDPMTPIEETADAMGTLLKQGKIRAIGVSNFSPQQTDEFRRVAPIHTAQPPYNLFEREIERERPAPLRVGTNCGFRLRRDLPRIAQRPDESRHPVRGRRSAQNRSQIPATAIRSVPRGGQAA